MALNHIVSCEKINCTIYNLSISSILYFIFVKTSRNALQSIGKTFKQGLTNRKQCTVYPSHDVKSHFVLFIIKQRICNQSGHTLICSHSFLHNTGKMISF